MGIETGSGQKPYITVLIVAYNYGRFIEECIDSALAQDYPSEKFEILVVDDGSTDDTAERVRKYGLKVRYFCKPNGGQASALNAGFAAACGEIISLLDADDYFFPNKLTRVAEVFERDPDLGMFYHPFFEFDLATNHQGVSRFSLATGSLAKNPERFLTYAGPGTCASFRRKFLDPLLPVPEEIRMLADGYLGSLIVFLAPILSVPECLAAYRFHGQNSYYADEDQMPPEMRKKRLRMHEIVLAAMTTWLANNGLTPKQPEVRFFFDRWKLTLENQRFILNPPGRIRLFRYLVTYNRFYGPYISRNLRIVNWFNAVGSLLTGYKYFHLLNRWRLAITNFFKRPSVHSSPE